MRSVAVTEGDKVEAQLKPDLRDRDFTEFDLDRAFSTVAGVAAALDATA